MKSCHFYNYSILIFLIIFASCSTSEIVLDKTAPNYSERSSVKNQPFNQTNKDLDFNKFLSGVNSVIVQTDEKFELNFEGDSLFFKKYYNLMKNYLSDIGIKNIAITNDEKNWISSNILFVNTATMNIHIDNSQNFISSVKMIFKSCNGDEFTFKTNSDYYLDKNWDKFLLEKMQEMYWQKVDFNPANTLALKKEMTDWNLKSIKNYLDKNDSDNLEGIYEKYGVDFVDGEVKYKIAVKKEGEIYNIIYLNGAEKTHNWTEGELKGEITKTSIKDFYKINWIMADKSSNENVYMNSSKYNFLEFNFLDNEDGYRTEYLKMYPRYSPRIASTENYSTSGTGFFVSSDGNLVTNHHVIKDANKILIQIEKSNSTKDYEAKIISDDKKNDLALLKIKDIGFDIDEKIPFQISISDLPMGTSVFTLGYPLIETMGETVKLSDGVISSNSGYMASSSAYQVTVPINPGNSGGPLFDKQGHLVGVINAKYSGAENVTYAIKSSILADFLHKNNIIINDIDKKILNNSNLVQQVKRLNKLVCLIKVYK